MIYRNLEPMLESLPMTDWDRHDLTLVILGLKPATEIEIPTASTGEVAHTLVRMRLAVRYAFTGPSRRRPQSLFFNPIVTVLCVAQEERDADELVHILLGWTEDRLGSADGLIRARGRLYGYPATAVEAFANGCELTNRHVVEKSIRPFLSFRLSQRHWKQELEFVQVQAACVYQSTPRLYRRIAQGRPLKKRKAVGKPTAFFYIPFEFILSDYSSLYERSCNKHRAGVA